MLIIEASLLSLEIFLIKKICLLSEIKFRYFAIPKYSPQWHNDFTKKTTKNSSEFYLVYKCYKNRKSGIKELGSFIKKKIQNILLTCKLKLTLNPITNEISKQTINY